MSEVKPSIQKKDLEKIDIRVGTILLVEDVPEKPVPAGTRAG